MAKSRTTLHKKGVYSLFWSFTLVLGAVLVLHFWNLRDEARSRAKFETLNIANALKEYTIRQLTTSDVLLTTQMESPVFQKAFKEKNEKHLHEILQKMQLVQVPPEEYILLDEKGNLIASSQRYPAKKENFNEANFFKYHAENTTKDIRVGEILEVYNTATFTIPLAKRLSYPDGRFAGILGMFMDPRSFQGFYKSLRLQNEDVVALLDDKGKFLMRFPWREEVVGRLRTQSLYVIDSVYNLPYGNTVIRSSVDGRPRVVGFTQFEKYPIVAASGRLTSLVYAGTWKAVYLLVPVYIGLVWLAFYLSRAFLISEFRLKHEVERAVLFEDTLKSINNRTSKEIGQKFLDTLVCEMGKVLKCRYVFVGEVTADGKRVRAVSSSLDGNIIPNVEYDLEHTPCEGVLKEEICYFSRGVQRIFPKDHLLTELGAESYLGVSLFDARRRALGILVGAHDAPMEDSDLITTVFSIFAARAGAEIERLHSEKSRMEAEEMKKKLESQTMQSQKMESMGRLASGIAHDFNNVLAAITANLEFARMKVDDKPASLDYINRADKASERARDLVRQILSFGRKGTLESQPLELSQLIQEVGQILRAGIGAHIEIRTLILDYDLKILANTTQIHQVLMNLCTNAAQAITGSSGLIEIILERENDDAKLTVRDNGIGMDSETSSRIFEPFFTTKTQGQGTGLGLAVVQGIVKNHGGRIEVKSAPQKGSDFILYFPLCLKKSTETIANKMANLPKGQGQDILVVDDESTMVELTCDILNDNGYKTTGFSYPQEAYRFFVSEPSKYSLVITDITMPGMRGEELVKMIREVRKDIPVIFTTGLDTELNQLQNIEGPYVTLQKPYNLWALVDAVGKFLRTKDKS